MTQAAPFRVGFVGLQPGRSWGAVAHLPALAGLPDDFVVAGVANSSPESGRTAAAALGLPRAFDSVADLVASPDVDVVAVTVKVPHHHAIVSAAIAAGKHVYCEWPLGNGLQEARDLARLRREKGIIGVVGLQALFSPEIMHMRELLAQGFVGEILSTTVFGVGGLWGRTIDRTSVYSLDKANGANLLTIPVGHTLAALTQALGPVAELSATLATRRPRVQMVDSGETVPATSPDQVLVSGILTGGAPVSLHYRGGTFRGRGLTWDIHGTEGDLRISADRGQTQLVQLALSGGRGEEKELLPLPLPDHLRPAAGEGPVCGNVRRIYAAMAADLRDGGARAPSFDDAVKAHQIVAAIERSAEQGIRVRPDAL